MQHFITHNKVSSNTATFKTMLIQCLESNTIALVAKTMYTLSELLKDSFIFFLWTLLQTGSKQMC